MSDTALATEPTEEAVEETPQDTIPTQETPTLEPETSTEPTPTSLEGDRDWTKAIKPDGTFDEAAYKYGMPEHMKSIGGMWESYQNLQRMKGMPGADATPEQISAYRQANGVPENVNAEAYGIEVPEALKEHYSDDAFQAIIEEANKSAHLGHTEVIKSAMAKFFEMEASNLESMTQDTEAQQGERLKTASEYLDKDENFRGQNRQSALQTTANGLNSALGELGVPSDSEEAQALRGFLSENPLGTRILHHFVSKTSQDGVPGMGAEKDLRSREELAESIMSDPNDPLHEAFHDSANPNHDKAKKQYWAHMGVSH